MTQEERKAKRRHDTRDAIMLLACIIGSIAVAVMAIIVAVSFYISGAKKPANNTGTVIGTEQEMPKAESEMTETETEMEKPVIDPLMQEAVTVVSGMSLEQKVAQMFVITPSALTGTSGATVVGNTTKSEYAKYPVGGLIYEKNNFTAKEQTQAMLDAMQALSTETVGLPIFLGVQEEGGNSSVIGAKSPIDVDDIVSMGEIGATSDPTNAYTAGASIGKYLNELGFNLNFAPVADVLTNESNTNLKGRSFGTDSALVGNMVLSVLQGLHENEVYGVVKYFPGYGSIAEDPHNGAVSTGKTLEELKAADLVPFQNAIDSGTDFIMVGHIAVPNVTGSEVPSSLSEQMIGQVLRKDMGFEGIVITDAMNMKAITDSYSSGDAAVAAVIAGADMILMPKDFHEAYDAVLKAVGNGTISEERINSAVVRIVKQKLKMQQ